MGSLWGDLHDGEATGSVKESRRLSGEIQGVIRGNFGVFSFHNALCQRSCQRAVTNRPFVLQTVCSTVHRKSSCQGKLSENGQTTLRELCGLSGKFERRGPAQVSSLFVQVVERDGHLHRGPISLCARRVSLGGRLLSLGLGYDLNAGGYVKIVVAMALSVPAKLRGHGSFPDVFHAMVIPTEAARRDVATADVAPSVRIGSFAHGTCLFWGRT